MRTRVLLWLLVSVMLALMAGCERPSAATPTAEIDEPGYRRGKELLRQGRDQEALGAFLRVIEQRGDDAPESHLEVALLYHRRIRDPIAAIYHFRKFLEMKPNSPQADLVRQQIAAAMRDFARTLPAQPHENQASRNDLFEVVERLQRENLELKEQLAGARAQVSLTAGTLRPTVADLSAPAATASPTVTRAGGPASVVTVNPVQDVASRPAEAPGLLTRVPLPAEEAPRGLQPPTRPGDPNANTPAAGARRHVVARGDTLYSLAQRYYNNRSRWRDIYAANRSRMSNENDLRVGMELVIPP
jgi:tetratricopeptide (TPR) repeat protein